MTLGQEEETPELACAFPTGEQEDLVSGDHLQGSEFPSEIGFAGTLAMNF